jgi:Tol biopolymer transport system component
MKADIMVNDRQTGLTELVSADASGAQGHGHSRGASISPDGRYVAFHSEAEDLVPDDTNGCVDIFVKDRITGDLFLVSVDSNGDQANQDCYGASMSSNGLVSFHTYADNQVPGDTNIYYDIFVHDIFSGETIRVSVDSSGNQGNGNSDMPKFSADGRYVSFHSYARNLVDDDTNFMSDIFVHDIETGETYRASVGASGEEGNGNCSHYNAISPEGCSVAFATVSDNLVPDDNNTWQDIFVHSRLSLTADTYTLPVAGGTVDFTLDANSDNAARNYLLLGSVTGTDPGFPLPGGETVLPLTWDPFTDLVLAYVNTSLFNNFMATLDGTGQSTAQLNAPALSPTYVGLVMYYAYCLNNPFNFVSNPVGIEIVP